MLRRRLRLRGWWRQLRCWWWWLRGWQRLPEIAQTAHCRRQTHRRLWPSNHNGRSKFRNLFIYISKITTNAPAVAPRLMEIIQTACSRYQKHRRRRPGDDQDWSKFRNYENLCLRDQAKPLEKHLFAVRSPLWRWHCALFFSYYHSQQLLFSLTKNNLSTTLTPLKYRDGYIEEFFL